jgi:hypothetical protein
MICVVHIEGYLFDIAQIKRKALWYSRLLHYAPNTDCIKSLLNPPTAVPNIG